MLCVFYVGRRSLFDFYRIQFSVAVKQQVDFLPVGIAEEIQIGFLAGVIVRFQYFAHDKGFINAARHCAVCKRLRCQPAAEIANKARVRKIYFWRLDDAFIDVQGERLQKIDNVGRLKNREPALYRFAVNADIPCERGGVQQLSRSACKGGHKLCKRECIAYGAELLDVAFNIGIYIGCIVLFPIHVFVRV